MTSADPKKQFFTVEEANQRLPLVRVIVSDIVNLFADVHERRQRLAEIRELPSVANRSTDNVYSEELDEMRRQLQQDNGRLDEFVRELLELGAQLKDPSVGLIDFPTIIDGREALLCWKQGEDEIGYWHEKDAGFSGRQSLLQGSMSTDNEDDESGAQ